ncbi:MAG: sigma-54 dependent transcriptional regulator [Deltaproteobacteria bacterium]|nr:sigma-54 dependent transcriptional regulator [Deltaproteobacteria bacterium]MCL5792702.1 sigma-54 dependent transcriptional regulator [Deltaproteobacteria bacterium]
MVNILVVDDDKSMREFLELMLRRERYNITTAKDGADAILLLKENYFELLISDLTMPAITGLELLKKSRELYPDIKVIMITAFGTVETAVEAMKLGAYDYITKPFNNDDLRIKIRRAIESQKIEHENLRLKQQLGIKDGKWDIIGVSDSMQQLFNMIDRVKDTRTNVLITGESGTGKELVARAIHYQGIRKDSAFVPINCGAIPENLVESELFGHKRGAFTGAVENKRGLFLEADTGTIFLDEVSELPLQTQVKLLRVIQERRVKPVGDSAEFSVDVRIITATNKDIKKLLKEGKFREDLFYRLNVMQIELKPLRERREDILPLLRYFLEKYNKELGKDIKDFSNESIERLKSYSYPGNVRELENIVERAVAIESSQRILPESLPNEIICTTSNEHNKIYTLDDISIYFNGVIDNLLFSVEKELIIDALNAVSGDKQKACELLGIPMRSLRYRIKKYGL